MKKIYNDVIRIINIIAIIIHSINVFILAVYITYEYIIYDYVFWLQMLPSNYIIFVAKFSLLTIIYSLIMLIVNRITHKTSIKNLKALFLLSICEFVVYFIHILNIV